MEAKTGSRSGTGGQILIVDASWRITVTLFDKYFPDQPDDVYVAGGNAFHCDVPGDYVKKTALESTGAEFWAEVLYHCGLGKDQIDSIVAHSKVTLAALPYITSQFMPRKISDRPKVIPDGCVNLAFLGQFAESGECVFTVEGSVHSAMVAVWGLTGLDKPMIPIPEPIYDLRVLAKQAKLMSGGKELNAETLSAMASGGDGGKTEELPTQLVSLLSQIPQTTS